MLRFFTRNHSWHAHFHMALLRGGNINEMVDTCEPLLEFETLRTVEADRQWFDAWYSLASHLHGLALLDERRGNSRTAARKYDRASIYYFTAEKMLGDSNERKSDAYERAMECFRRSIEYFEVDLHWVDIPFGSTTFPALFVPASGSDPSPCVIHFNGFDGTKEIVYQRLRTDYQQRGISLLLVDHPGTGEALRRRKQHLDHRTENAASACVDYLQGRSGVIAGHIGVMGVAAGSYHAARAAAFEKRIKYCVCWGGYWRPPADFLRVEEPDVESVPGFHNMWITGTDSLGEAARILAKMTLEDVMPEITCPLLVVVGESDRRMGLFAGVSQIEAATSSSNRHLRLFTRSEGGSEYCQNDNSHMGSDYIADWIHETCCQLERC